MVAKSIHTASGIRRALGSGRKLWGAIALLKLTNILYQAQKSFIMSFIFLLNELQMMFILIDEVSRHLLQVFF
jgi:hypothetical protein